MDNKRLYTNLVTLLRVFKDRPNHLAKYLIDNESFTDEFISKIIESDKLSSMLNEEDYDYFSEELNIEVPFFVDYNEMGDYYNNIMKEGFDTNDIKFEEDLNTKLKSLIKNESFEEAAKLRDYMIKNNINIDI